MAARAMGNVAQLPEGRNAQGPGAPGGVDPTVLGGGNDPRLQPQQPPLLPQQNWRRRPRQQQPQQQQQQQQQQQLQQQQQQQVHLRAQQHLEALDQRNSLPQQPLRHDATRCISDATQNADEVEAIRRNGVTTLMIRNLPAEVTQTLFLQELDQSGFVDLYDFAYMPSSFESQEGKGYAFVNFVSVAVAGSFIGSWHKSKHCGAQGPFLNISPATVQGLEGNVKKWAGQRMGRIRNPALCPFVRQPGSGHSSAGSCAGPRAPSWGSAMGAGSCTAAGTSSWGRAVGAVGTEPPQPQQDPSPSNKWQGPQRRQAQWPVRSTAAAGLLFSPCLPGIVAQVRNA